jgi:hypothetical protein
LSHDIFLNIFGHQKLPTWLSWYLFIKTSGQKFCDAVSVCSMH